MRVKYEAYRDGEWLVAKAVVTLNKRERKRLAELLKHEGEITLCFWTTLAQVENPLVIEQVDEVPFEPDAEWDEWRELDSLLGMVEDEVADLRSWLEHGEPKFRWATKQKGVSDNERLHCTSSLAC